MGNRSDQETMYDPLLADSRKYYKVKKWTKDGTKIMLYAGSSLDKAQRVFDRWAKHRPRIRTRVLWQWPPG